MLTIAWMLFGISSAQASMSWTDHCKPLGGALAQAVKDYPGEVFDRTQSEVKPQETGGAPRGEDETFFFVKLRTTTGKSRLYLVRMSMNAEADNHRAACRLVEARKTTL